MEYRTLLVTQNELVRTIKINRPDKLNALSLDVIRELVDAFKAAQVDENVRCIILTGEGPKAFIAGADITQFVEMNATRAREFSVLGGGLISLIENLGKPVIACINGFALGGGCEVALGCTLRVASETAQLGQPEINLGIMPGFGGSQRLARIVGKGRAMELCLLGDRIPAQRAYEMGLVNILYKPDELQAKTAELAKRISQLAPIAVKYILEAVNRGSEASLERSLECESQLFALCFATEDKTEGAKAFVEKRKANWKGR